MSRIPLHFPRFLFALFVLWPSTSPADGAARPSSDLADSRFWLPPSIVEQTVEASLRIPAAFHTVDSIKLRENNGHILHFFPTDPDDPGASEFSGGPANTAKAAVSAMIGQELEDAVFVPFGSENERWIGHVSSFSEDGKECVSVFGAFSSKRGGEPLRHTEQYAVHLCSTNESEVQSVRLFALKPRLVEDRVAYREYVEKILSSAD